MTQVFLTDLFAPAALEHAINTGHVRRQLHPTEPLAVLNYTEVCAYDGAWNPVTLACRGLIYRTDTGEVVARPMAKFFNHGQPGAPTLDLDGPALVTDKADGSLGILYPMPSGGWAVATRGSFTSEQAVHATTVWTQRYAHRFMPRPAQTTLFEIIYPGNRIVLDYAGMDDLLLLGAVETATGAVLDPTRVGHWPGPVVQTFPVASLAAALALPPRPNAEGLVVRCLTTGDMVKIKQADYVALHKIVTGLTARVVWQHLLDGKPLDELVAPLPDEFHQWCREVAATLIDEVDRRASDVRKAYAELIGSLPVGFTRKDFAAVAVPHPQKWAMFLLLDGRDIMSELWKRAKPEPYLTPSGRTFTEDNA